MARSLQAVWVLRARMVAESALAVGGLDGDTDLPVARDGAGRPYVPGTTLAGCMRSAVARWLDDAGLLGQARHSINWHDRDPADAMTATERLFGHSTEIDDGGYASPLQVRDAPLLDAMLARRDGVGIDRGAGAAADQILYSREVVSAGATLDLVVEVEVPDPAVAKGGRAREQVQRQVAEIDTLLPQLAGLLEAEGLRVGAATGRGLGRLKVQGDLSLARLELGRREHLSAWWQLRADRGLPDPLPDGAARTPSKPSMPEDRWVFTVYWQPTGPVMVKDGGDGAEIQQIPLVVRRKDGSWHAALPGGAIKGALRAHAERVVRTVKGQHDGLSTDFKEQVRLPVVDDLFGRRRAQGSEVARGALTADDCLHDQPLDLPPSGLRDQARLLGWPVRTRVAVDRWTGGALEGALFQLLEPRWQGCCWAPLVLEVDLHRLIRPNGDAEQARRCLALLWLVLRDLAEERLPLGFGTRRGMGNIRVERIEATRGSTTMPALKASMVSDDKDWQTIVKSWEAAWQTFIQP